MLLLEAILVNFHSKWRRRRDLMMVTVAIHAHIPLVASLMIHPIQRGSQAGIPYAHFSLNLLASQTPLED